MIDPRAKAFGARLKELREEAQMNRKELAEACNCEHYLVAGWETGESGMPALTDQMHIATALGISLRRLQGRPENPRDENADR